MEEPLPGSLVARSIRKPYHQKHQQQRSAPFAVMGVHALLFDDDTLAAFTDSPAALLPWNGDQTLLIDRYDVRHLLQDLSGIRKRRSAPPLLDTTDEELNYERYRDLKDHHPNHHGEGHQSSEELSNSLSGGCQAVPFSYSAKATEGGTQSESASRSMSFLPPFPVPDFLLSKLPPSKKFHQIMVGTAKFVNEHGGQSEILLKVKQGDNPMFGFLNADHHLHEYYRFLLQHPDLLQPVFQNSARPADVATSSGEGLSLLGSAYGTGDDDDDDGTGKSKRDEEDVGPVNTGAVLLEQEGLKADDGATLKVDVIGHVAAQDAAAAASSHTGRLPEGSELKVVNGASRGLSQSDKKKKIFVGTKKLIQPNKNIISHLGVKVNGIPPRDVVGATGGRLPVRSQTKVSSWQSVPSSKEKEYGMSADAAAAVVFAATRGATAFRQDSSNNKSSSSSGLSQRVFDAARELSASGGSEGVNAFSGARGSGQSAVSIAKAVAQAAAFVAAHEADSADALLTPAEKLKAERLRRAKMFAAMIRSGKCESVCVVKPAGPLVATVLSGSEAVGSGSNTITDTDIGDVNRIEALKRGWNQDLEQLASKSMQNEYRFMDSFPQPLLNKNPEEVEGSDVNKGDTAHWNTDSKGKHLEQDSSVEERSHHKPKRAHGGASKDYHRTKRHRSDSEERERHRKKKSHQDHGADEKHRHSKHKKHKDYHSDSADAEYSSGRKEYHRSRVHINAVQDHHHYRRKRSHHDYDDVQDGKHRHSRHKAHDDDSHSDSADQKQRRRKHLHRALSLSEEEVPRSSKYYPKECLNSQAAASGQEEQSLSPAYPKAGSLSDDYAISAVTVDVPAEIRAKVRAMLLSTL